MPRHPGDERPDPPGGRAAERLRAFLKGRFPRGQVPPSGDVPPILPAPEQKHQDEPAEPSSEPTEEDEG